MKTDNSHLQEKIELRLDAIDCLCKDSVRVLDLFAGKSVLWTHVKNELPMLDIKVLSVEKEKGKNTLAINADNLKVIDNIDLSRFDIIDIDAYGIPFAQLDKIFRKGYHGIVVVTCISSMFGALPKGLLEVNRISAKMYAKIPSIFSTKMFAYMENYLYLSGVQRVKGFFLDNERKYYFYFKI